MKMHSRLFFFVATLLSLSCLSQDEPAGDTLSLDGKIFRMVDSEASFPGGDDAWRMYLIRNVNGQVPTDKFAPPGFYTVIVQFIVDKNGDISDVKPLTNHGFGMEEEVVRIIKRGPQWKPALINKQPVKAYRKQPVTFQVISEFKLSTYSLQAGQENTVEVKINGVKDEDLEVTISSGKIMLLSGKTYSIKPARPGKLLLTVTKKVKRKTVEVGKVMLEVK